MLVRIGFGLVAAMMLLAVAAPTALAEGALNIDRDDNMPGARVTVSATHSRTTGTPGTAASAVCSRPDGQQVPCWSEKFGWWYSPRNCYVRLVRVARPDEPEHHGQGWYRCDPGDLGFFIPGPTDLFIWLELGAAGPEQATLVDQAIDSMRLTGITIGTAPPPGTPTLINMPLWLWAHQPGPTTWGPATATATAGPLTITATGQATTITWNMGNGDHTTCQTGQPWTPHASTRHACTYTYRQPGTYPITATTTWQINWTSNAGTNGTRTLTTSNTTTITAHEARAIITNRN